MQRAIDQGDVHEVGRLIGLGFPLNEPMRGIGHLTRWTLPIEYAIFEASSLRIIRLLVEKGADLEKISDSFYYNLFVSRYSLINPAQIMKAIAQGLDKERLSNAKMKGVTLLGGAVIFGNLSSVQTFLEMGADANVEMHGEEKQIALEMGFYSSNIDILSLLIPKSNLFHQSKRGTALEIYIDLWHENEYFEPNSVAECTAALYLSMIPPAWRARLASYRREALSRGRPVTPKIIAMVRRLAETDVATVIEMLRLNYRTHAPLLFPVTDVQIAEALMQPLPEKVANFDFWVLIEAFRDNLP